MVRVVIVDRRPAVRRGYASILGGARGLTSVGCAAGRGELWPLAYTTDPDVALIADPRSDDALGLGMRFARRFPRTRIVVAADEDIAVAAAFARVHGVVAPAAGERVLEEVLRAVGAGSRRLPDVTPAAQTATLADLGAVDRAIVAMRMAGTPDCEIGDTIGVPCERLPGRLAGILAALLRSTRTAHGRPLSYAA